VVAHSGAAGGLPERLEQLASLLRHDSDAVKLMALEEIERLLSKQAKEVCVSCFARESRCRLVTAL
jgi:hypothetical protein